MAGAIASEPLLFLAVGMRLLGFGLGVVDGFELAAAAASFLTMVGVE